jgi:hypothetical protein
MKIGNQTFRFGKKKKKSPFPSLEALKTISFVTGSSLAINKALKQKIQEQQRMLLQKKKKESDDASALLGGFIGGIIAGSLVALLLAPESGDKLRERISSFFLTDEGDISLQEILRDARHKAEAQLGVNGNK